MHIFEIYRWPDFSNLDRYTQYTYITYSLTSFVYICRKNLKLCYLFVMHVTYNLLFLFHIAPIWGQMLCTLGFICIGIITLELGARIFKLLRSPGIDLKESMSPACVAWYSQYDKPIPSRFL
jgi:hypothetical protein